MRPTGVGEEDSKTDERLCGCFSAGSSARTGHRSQRLGRELLNVGILVLTPGLPEGGSCQRGVRKGPSRTADSSRGWERRVQVLEQGAAPSLVLCFESPKKNKPLLARGLGKGHPC